MTSRSENEARALRISRATGLLYPGESDAATLLSDLLADARHFADREGLDFGECDARGYRHYGAEVFEARGVSS